MANVRGKTIDNTHLSIDQAEDRGFLHRDYIAHCLRWTHVVKYLSRSQAYKSARVLDVGCGVDVPLAKLLYSSRLIVDDYIGVDYNASKKFKLDAFHTGKFPVLTYGGVDFASKQVEVVAPKLMQGDTEDPVILRLDGDDGVGEHILPNTIVSFEVMEHVEPEHTRRMLKKMHDIMWATRNSRNEDPVLFISTPCYDPNVGAAGNHVNEITYQALGYLFETLGFVIERHYGTFASMRDYKPFLKARGLEEVFNQLSEYYDSNYLATVFAPLFPSHARNCLWVLRLADRTRVSEYFVHSGPGAEPWTSSVKWKELYSDEGSESCADKSA